MKKKHNEEFGIFFHFELSAMPVKSLQFSQEALVKRDKFHIKIEGLQFSIIYDQLKKGRIALH